MAESSAPLVMLAPMAGITDAPFRRAVGAFGPVFLTSEMVAGEGMLRGEIEMLARAGLDAADAVQLAGRDPVAMAEAARALAGQGARVIDINMGCPARRVTTGACGAALLREPDRALAIIGAVVGAVRVPVTLKTRLGWDMPGAAVALARAAQDAGVARIVIHGRTRNQFYRGQADWPAIRAVVEAVRIPVIANGDILDAVTARAAMAASGAAGVMLGRGAQGAPWVPAQVAANLAGRPVPDAPRGGALGALVAEHYDRALAAYGRDLGLRVARKHLGWYLDAAGVARGDMLVLDDPAAVLRRLAVAFDEREAA